MKILFTGGGSGGHFYPIIAIAEAINYIAERERLIYPELFFIAPEPYEAGLLAINKIKYLRIKTGKLRRYFSLKNAIDAIKIIFGVLKAFIIVFKIFPDVIVGKGGFGSFPVLLAARLYGIPVLIHESDSVPGRVNKWAGKFARRVALSYAEAGQYFPQDKVAVTGTPIRQILLKDFDQCSLDSPLVLILGGSLGAMHINEVILKILPELLNFYTVIHQTGEKNFEDIAARSRVLLQEHALKTRYMPVGYLSSQELTKYGHCASLVISRAGSAIFEIAIWGKPSIIIPISDSNGDHQRENAYCYARSGSAEVIEESNLTPTILLGEIEKIIRNDEKWKLMSNSTKLFSKTDSALIIAREIIKIALKHEK